MAWTTREQIKALTNTYDTLRKASKGWDLKAMGKDRWIHEGMRVKRLSLRAKKHVTQIECLVNEIGHIGDYVDRYISGTTNQGQPRGCYDFVPFCNGSLVDTLLKIMRYHKAYHPSHRPLRFIDAGCGIGTKVIIAEAMGCVAEGLEISKKLIEDGKKLFQFNGRHPRILQGDIRNHEYSKYDIIYFYCPLSNKRQEKIFEELVWKQAKVGTYVIAYGLDIYPSDQKFIELASRSIYLKYAP